MVAYGEDAVSTFEPQLPGFEHAAVMVAEDRQEYAIAQSALGRVPVDVEVRRIAAGWAVLQHIPPPRVLGARDRHMIGHNVEHLAEPMTAERLAEAGVGLSPAQLLIEAVGVHDVIAMRAPPAGLQIRRAIEVTDTPARLDNRRCRQPPQTRSQRVIGHDTWRGSRGPYWPPSARRENGVKSPLPYNIAEC